MKPTKKYSLTHKETNKRGAKKEKNTPRGGSKPWSLKKKYRKDNDSYIGYLCLINYIKELIP